MDAGQVERPVGTQDNRPAREAGTQGHRATSPELAGASVSPLPPGVPAPRLPGVLPSPAVKGRH